MGALVGKGDCMSSVLINNAKIVLEDTILENHSVYCVDGRIEKIIPTEKCVDIIAQEMVDASGMYLVPGYIDLHIHGIKGMLVDKGREHLEGICKALPQYGVTSFLPSVCPAPSELDDYELLSSLSNGAFEGANILGFLEGHFLALTGAIRNIPQKRSKERVEKLMEAAEPYKVVFGISPEIENISELIPFMRMLSKSNWK